MSRRMIDTSDFTVKNIRYTENWFHFPTFITIPFGCYYKTDTDYKEGYEFANGIMEKSFECAGDHLTIIYLDKKLIEYHFME